MNIFKYTCFSFLDVFIDLPVEKKCQKKLSQFFVLLKKLNIIIDPFITDEKELVPPNYTNCPPNDIKPVYVASAREKTVRITWSAPIGHAEHEIES